jgi:dihydroxyacetone kinase-like predicted kinase
MIPQLSARVKGQDEKAHGALMGARGNSGVILAQFWRGLAKGLEGKTHFNGGDFAKALARASQTAYKGIVKPVEGTILTVLKDASKAAREAVKDDGTLVLVLEAAVKSAEEWWMLTDRACTFCWTAPCNSSRENS